MINNGMMKFCLNKHVISALLNKGFTGKYPHFRRECANCIELVSFQTNKWGGAFIVEVSAVFPNSKNKNYTEWEGLTEDQITVWNTNERYLPLQDDISSAAYRYPDNLSDVYPKFSGVS